MDSRCEGCWRCYYTRLFFNLLLGYAQTQLVLIQNKASFLDDQTKELTNIAQDWDNAVSRNADPAALLGIKNRYETVLEVYRFYLDDIDSDIKSLEWTSLISGKDAFYEMRIDLQNNYIQLLSVKQMMESSLQLAI